MLNQPWDLVWFILGAIIIIIAAYYTTYYLGKRSLKNSSGRNIKVRERFAVSKDKGLYLVEVRDKVYFVAITNRSITLLDTMDTEGFDERADMPSPARPAMPGGLGEFFTRFGAAMKANFTAMRKPVRSERDESELYDLDKRISLQNAREEDNLDMVFREMQTGLAKRRNSASRGENNDEK